MTVVEEIPALAADHVPPASLLRQTPPLTVPAYSLRGAEGSIASAKTDPAGRPELDADQLMPRLDDLKTPPAVPA
jgi:hypothetical protein